MDVLKFIICVFIVLVEERNFVIGACRSNNDFECSQKGRFLNPEDESCSTYFLCSLLRNGTFIKTLYHCPSGSGFDPEIGVCRASYECLCSTTSSTEETTETSTSTTPEGCFAYQNYSKDFVCSEKGRFLNAQDDTCTSYFLCSLLRNGSFIKTLYDCPSGSVFDPEIEVCSESYQCPCSTTTTPSSTEETTETSTSTTPDGCLAYQNYTKDFVCSEKGRFLNAQDETCTTYFLCSLLRNGSFIRTLYDCPSGSVFDPEIEVCSESYQCPCSTTTTPSSTKETTETSTSTTPDGCLAYQNYTKDFVCSEKGRFLNAQDETCTTYFLCSLLRNGSFIKTLYDCPSGSVFDPEIEVCSESYQCPCSTTTTPSSTEETTETSTSTTPDGCLAYQNYTKDFVCSEKGRFLNAQDETCTTYFLCSLLRNGSFIRTLYDCPSGSVFDPEIEVCSESYQCPCSTTTTPSSTEETTETSTSTTPDGCLAYQNYTKDFVCSEKGRFLNAQDETCTTYFLCSLLRNGSFIRTLYDCPSGSVFDPEIEVCSESYQCPCSTTTTPSSTEETTETSTSTTPDGCLAYQNYTKDFVCSEKGRFLNAQDETCTTYFLCSLLRNGSFIKTLYDCPSGSVFDPEIEVCSESYQCPCSITTTPSSTEETTETSTSTTPDGCLAYQNYTKDFVCSEKGRFLNAQDETCTTYFLCSLLRNGSFIKTLYDCPSGSVFDPEIEVCSESYQCPCSSTTTPSSTEETTETSTSTTPDGCLAYQNYTKDFVCSEEGRFLNAQDETCTTYFLCSLLRNGSFIKTLYDCPSGSVFDPEIEVCSESYQCPCSTTTTPSSTEETTETSTSTTPDGCLAYHNYTKDFVCSEEGRFLNAQDETCTTYFLCSLLRNGTFIKTLYDCPSGSVFDPEIEVCSESYQCPCSTTTTAATSLSTAPDCSAYNNYTKELVCTEAGEILNAEDETCTSYFKCSRQQNGSFIKTQYDCPSGTTFDPVIKVCRSLYGCPCFTATRLTTVTLTSEGTTTPASTLCLAYRAQSENLACSEKGRFANVKDETCSSYFLCSLLRNGSFIQTEYFCPEGSRFDSQLQICSSDYECPCLTTRAELSFYSGSGQRPEGVFVQSFLIIFVIISTYL